MVPILRSSSRATSRPARPSARHPLPRLAWITCTLGAAVSGAWAQAAADTVSPPAASLPAVTVKAQAGEASATGQVDGYRATRQASGTKTDTPLAETPQSVSVITRDELDDRGVTSLSDALRYSAGVNPSGFNYGGDVFTIRGFSVGVAGLYLDGLRAFSNVFSSAIEPYGAERIEVVRGPASVLYGQATPGGLVNIVSKRPQADLVNTFGVEMGTPTSGQVTADVGGRLDGDGAVLGRLVFLGRDGSTQFDFIEDDRLYIAPSLTWQPSTRTTLTLLGSYNRDRNGYARGSQYWVTGPNPPGQAIALNHPLVQPGTAFNFSGPGTGYRRIMQSLGYQFEHRFEHGLTVRQNLRFSDITTDRREQWASYFGPTLGLQNDGRTLLRQAVNRPDADQSLGIDTQAEYQVRTGPVAHTLLVGLDLRRNRLSQGIYSDQQLRPLDLLAPVWVEPDWQSMNTLLSDGRTEGRSAGLYLQEQAKIGDRVVVMASVRRDRYREVSDDVNIADPVAGTYVTTHADETTWATTGRVGAVFLAPSGLSPYVSYATSFEPNAGADISGQRFEPSRGKQAEVGLRYAPADVPLSVLASVYDLRKTNVLMTPNPGQPTVAEGEVRSRGLELQATYEMLRGWTALANYAYTDTETLKGSPASVGRATVGVPRHAASAWTKARIDRLVPGLTLGGGVRYLGESLSGSATNPNPAATLVDVMAEGEFGGWTLSASVENLADRLVLTECTAVVCTVGYGREARLRAVYHW